MPPPKVAVTVPPAGLAQGAFVCVRLKVTAAGWPTISEPDCVHPLASFTIHVYVPAARPEYVLGDVWAAKAPPLKLTVYGAVPPLKVRVTEPSVPPLQAASVWVSVATIAVGWPTTSEPDCVQPFASFTIQVYVPA